MTTDAQALTVTCPLCHRLPGWSCVYSRPTRVTPLESVDPGWRGRVGWLLRVAPDAPEFPENAGRDTKRPHTERREAFTDGTLTEWLREFGDIFAERRVIATPGPGPGPGWSPELTAELESLRSRLGGRMILAETTSEQRVWIKHAGGSGGWLTTARCPNCAAMVVYNGNYFCERLGDECDWALDHPATTPGDRRVCDVVGIGYD